MALHGEDMYVREINCYDILYKIVVEKCDLIHHEHSLMQRILSVCLSVHYAAPKRVHSGRDSLALAHEDVLASTLMLGFNNSKLDVDSSWLPLWLLQCDCSGHNNIDN